MIDTIQSSAPTRPTALSLLRMPIAARLAIAGAAIVLLWLAVLAALP